MQDLEMGLVVAARRTGACCSELGVAPLPAVKGAGVFVLFLVGHPVAAATL